MVENIDGTITVEDEPFENAVVQAYNLTKGTYFGHDLTGEDGSYLLEGDADPGDTLKITVDAKRDGAENVTRVVYPVVGTDGQTNVTDSPYDLDLNEIDANKANIIELDSTIGYFATSIDEDYEVPAEKGVVIAGPLEGEGSITGEGRLKVV